MGDQRRAEAKVLFFERTKAADGVHVANVALRTGESSTFHLHPRTRDTFFVSAGRLTVMILFRPRGEDPPYRHLCATPPEMVEVGGRGEQVHVLCVLPGEVLQIEPGVVHCAANRDEEVCRFLCVEGVGEYEFVDAEGVVGDAVSIF